MTVYEKGLVTVLICAVLFILISVPLVLRRVPRNIAYGFRTRATLNDDYLWYEANAHFGRGLIIASVVSMVCAGILYAVRSAVVPELFLKISIIALVVPSLAATFSTFRFLRSLAGKPERK